MAPFLGGVLVGLLVGALATVGIQKLRDIINKV